MEPGSYSGSATKRGGSAIQIRLRVTGAIELRGGVTVDLGTPFSGSYNSTTKSAEVTIDQTNFDALNSKLAQGAVRITVVVDSNSDITQFWYAGICLSAMAGLAAAREVAAPISGLTESAGAAATGTE